MVLLTPSYLTNSMHLIPKQEEFYGATKLQMIFQLPMSIGEQSLTELSILPRAPVILFCMHWMRRQEFSYGSLGVPLILTYRHPLWLTAFSTSALDSFMH